MKKKSKRALKRVGVDMAGAAGGAAVGAVAGAFAGPAGVVLGAIAGAAAGAVATEEGVQSQHALDNTDRQLDKDIGVSGGEMGAPNLKHPPAKVGAFSAASSGGGGGGGEVAEGPMSPPGK